jgi:signal transduction histidine kinase
MKELGIDMEEIRRRMLFVDFTENDIRLLSEMEPFAREHADQLVASFYQHLMNFEETRRLLRDPATVDRLMKSQKEYLLDIFRGKFDEAYFERRLRIGAVHHRIGLEPKWYIGTYCLYENLLSALVTKAYAHEPDKGLARIMAIRRIFRLDMAVALDFYHYRIVSQLREKMREMDDFVHVVSHDLKEPLRGIEAFAGFLMEDYGSKLDEEGKRYLQFLKTSAVRMHDLIRDLLALASLSRKEASLQRVDLNGVLAQIRRDLDYAIQQKGAEIEVRSPLPTVFVDPTQIGEVFKNLLSNSIKFSRLRPRIEILALEEDRSHRISVKDNGIGIEPEYHQQIFGLFERLHPQEQFEGTGAGLAICKKVIEGYGGRIWVESRPGEGSTFYFTLPKERAGIALSL